ncbi:MAG: MerR family DNA-binding protein [Chromatiales bacterium]|nr:MerR family DNA-binding protein [Chromatiales bacterium]
MRIGQLAALGRTIVETIRYYERIGLMPVPDRNGSGYRHYREEHLRRLVLIRRSRDLGFSLGEIRSLLMLADDPARSCAEVTSLARAHLREVRQRLEGLRALELELEQLAESCQGRHVSDCTILEKLGRTEQNLDAHW